MSAPRVASEQSAYCQIKPFYWAVLPEGFEGILGTCGGEAAGRRLQRGYAHLIEPDEQNEREDQNLPDDGSSLYVIRLLLHSVG